MDTEKVQVEPEVPTPREEILSGFRTALETAQTPEVKTAIESARVNMEAKWKSDDEARETEKKAAITADLTAIKDGDVPEAVMEAIQAAMEANQQTPTTPALAETDSPPVLVETPGVKTENKMENTEKFINAAKSILDEARDRVSKFLLEAKKIDLRNTMGWALTAAGTQSVLYAWAATLPAISGGNEFVQTAGLIVSSAFAAFEFGASYVLFREEFKVRSAKAINTPQQ